MEIAMGASLVTNLVTQLPAHVLTWSAQVLLLTAAGALVALTLANARARLLFWQGLLLTMLLLPMIEPWQSSPILVVQSTPEIAPVLPVADAMTQPGLRWNWLLVIGAGAVLRLVWIAAGFWRLRGYRTRATLLTEPPLRFASSSARWYVSDTLPGPVTYGWLRPSILLPARAMQLLSPQREAIACHELMHVRRRDWLFVLAEEAIRSLLWFHPAVWFVLSRIQLAREQVVDSEVVSLTEDRDGYLEALVEVAARKLQPDLAPAPLFLRKRHLAVRVAAVLKEVSMSKSHLAARLTVALSAMVVAVLVATWFVPFVSSAQTVMDDPGVTVDPGGTLMHRAPVRNRSNASGTITLEATLNVKGEVTDAHVLSGPDDLRNEALSSVLQWHYSPGLSRVQISMRFDPAAVPTRAANGKQVAGGVTGGFVGVAGGRSGPRTAIISPDPPGTARTVTSIDFLGFTPEAERELRTRLPIHEGDTLTPEDMGRVSIAVREFDSHATVTQINRQASDVGLRIMVIPVLEALAAPPPPPPPAPQPGASTVPGIPAIGGAVMAANVVQKAVPVYPPLAKNARIQGIVKLHVIVAKDGTIEDAQIISGHPLLVPAAQDAVRQWIYRPTLLNGEPVKVQTDVEVNFTLSQ